MIGTRVVSINSWVFMAMMWIITSIIYQDCNAVRASLKVFDPARLLCLIQVYVEDASGSDGRHSHYQRRELHPS